MSDSKLAIYFVFFFFCFASSSYFSTTLTTSHQCSALFLFKQNLSSFNFSLDYPRCKNWPGSDYYPVMMNWNTSIDCCHWDGVTCDRSTGDVIGLDLSCGMLQGTLHPNTSLFNLPHLQRLNLAYNDFSGSQLPREIGRFSNTLTHLNISNCRFSGQVPTDITLLRKLVSLDLSWNNIVISLDLIWNKYDNFSLRPDAFINLLRSFPSLEELELANVNISSVLPTYLNISSTSLKSLNLQQIGLHGKLPHYIFRLQSLEKLDLSVNNLAGQIPGEISLLSKLVSFDISYNDNLQIEPHIFNSLLQNYTHLRDLSLGDVNISLVLPTYLNISSSLKTLDLHSTGLKGKLPNNIFNLYFLETLDLSGNTNLTGPLPKVNTSITNPPLKQLDLSSTYVSVKEIHDSIGHLKFLNSLDLSNCGFMGSLPKSLVNLRHLTRLDLSYNSFSGDWELDTLLSSLTNLVLLDLSYSGLTVTNSNANHHVNPTLRYLNLASCKIKVFPESLRSMRNLIYLDLSSNEIHGHIPDWVGEIEGSNLLHLDLSQNFITGLPQFQWYGLRELYLQSNLIEGPFPSSICNIINLWYMDISNNRFDGEIPQCLGNITSSVRMMNLGNNRFQGSIPNVYGNCGGLEGLILNGNWLEGEVPSSLSICQSLKVLDMGNNQLNGTFPHWLGSLPNLLVLVLKSNNFHGIIETSSSIKLPFPSLRVLDISHNWFVGQLPRKYFQSFNAMKNIVRTSRKPEYLTISGINYSITLATKGVEQFFPKILVEYSTIDVSSNRFEGEIPDIMGSLYSLIVLNLSHNSLTGQIPQALGDLSEIESLDLSCNQLIGEIPQSLADLTFLAYLNLSENHLMGRIPAGKQFNTFEGNSFSGNPKLCGLLLPKKCNESPQEQLIEGDGDDDYEESGFTWRVVMFGYACGTLFGLVMGYLMLRTGRPMWFNAIADAGEHMILKRRNKRR